MTDLIPILVDIASTPRQNYCHCGEPIRPLELFCSGCYNQRHAERMQEFKSFHRDIYGEDV